MSSVFMRPAHIVVFAKTDWHASIPYDWSMCLQLSAWWWMCEASNSALHQPYGCTCMYLQDQSFAHGPFNDFSEQHQLLPRHCAIIPFGATLDNVKLDLPAVLHQAIITALFFISLSQCNSVVLRDPEQRLLSETLPLPAQRQQQCHHVKCKYVKV